MISAMIKFLSTCEMASENVQNCSGPFESGMAVPTFEDRGIL